MSLAVSSTILTAPDVSLLMAPCKGRPPGSNSCREHCPQHIAPASPRRNRLQLWQAGAVGHWTIEVGLQSTSGRATAWIPGKARNDRYRPAVAGGHYLHRNALTHGNPSSHRHRLGPITGWSGVGVVKRGVHRADDIAWRRLALRDGHAIQSALRRGTGWVTNTPRETV